MKKKKDSGIEWIGLIPEDWEIVRGRNLYSIATGKKDSGEYDENGLYPFFTCSTEVKWINSYCYDGEVLLISGNGAVGFTRYYKGKFDAYQRTYYLHTFNYDLISIYYLKYYVSYLLTRYLENKYVGSVIDFIKLSDLKNFFIAVPPRLIQSRIADFLDDKCGKIDRYIEKQRQIIEKLKAYKQSVITEAVTKGLDPAVPMKDSGVEWIGMIPAHWNMRRLRYLGTCINGISKGGEFFGSGYPFVSYGDVYKNMELPKTVAGLVESTDSERNWYSVREGDVFFTRTSETIEEVALTSTCMQTIENATFAGFLIRFRPSTNLLTKQFSKYYFRSDKHRLFFVKEMNLVTRASLSQELLKRLPVLLPPVEEQKQIAAFLDRKCFEIDNMIDKKQVQIDKLIEYKKSLIYEAVTGKLEV